MNALRRWLEYWTYVVGSTLLRLLPVRVLHVIAGGLARLFILLDSGRMRTTRVNLKVAFPDWDEARREAVARASVQNFALNVLDFVRSEVWDERELAEHVGLEGLEHYQRAHARGKGVLMLASHLGNFELAVRRGSVAGIKQLVIGKPMRNARIYERLQKSRESHGSELIDRDEAGVRMMRWLRKGGAITVANDHYAHRARAVFSPFFGVRVSTYAGVGMLAARTGAAICPAYAVRDGKDHHMIRVLPELQFERTGDRDRDLAAATEACNAAYEEIIRKHPEEWMWGHRRFKHSPDLPEDLYSPGASS